MNLPRKIRQLRESKDMSQADLAEKSGLSATYISMVENGKKSPTLKSLQKISEAINIPFPILSFLSLDKDDVAEKKRPAFELLRPAIMAMIEEFFLEK